MFSRILIRYAFVIYKPISYYGNAWIHWFSILVMYLYELKDIHTKIRSKTKFLEALFYISISIFIFNLCSKKIKYIFRVKQIGKRCSLQTVDCSNVSILYYYFLQIFMKWNSENYALCFIVVNYASLWLLKIILLNPYNYHAQSWSISPICKVSVSVPKCF